MCLDVLSCTGMKDTVTRSKPWWAGEEALLVSDVPRCLPRNAKGRKVHVGSVYRWARGGLRGLRIRVFLLGGRFATTREELDRFFLALTEQSNAVAATPNVKEIRERGLL